VPGGEGGDDREHPAHGGPHPVAAPPPAGPRDERGDEQQGQQEVQVVGALQHVGEAVTDHVGETGARGADGQARARGVEDPGRGDLAGRVGEDDHGLVRRVGLDHRVVGDREDRRVGARGVLLSRLCALATAGVRSRRPPVRAVAAASVPRRRASGMGPEHGPGSCAPAVRRLCGRVTVDPQAVPRNVPATGRSLVVMNLRTTIASVLLTAVVGATAACGIADGGTTGTTNTGTSTSSERGPRGGGPGGVEVGSVSTEAELIALVQAAYGDGDLDLHRGHQPVQDVLDEVLGISHDELHVRMDAGQNLSAVAEDLGVGTQALVDALVAAWSPAVDAVLASGEITEAEAGQYRAALAEAFTFRVTWNGADAMPTFSGPAA
jgi:hypothetical protein